MTDRLARTLSADGTVRGLAAVTTELVEEARVRHGTLPTATAALGRALTAGLLLGGLSKADERVSLQWSGDGPLGSILTCAASCRDRRPICPRAPASSTSGARSGAASSA